MKAIGTVLCAALASIASAAGAGDVAEGKICAFDFHGFIPDGSVCCFGDNRSLPCSQALYGTETPNFGVYGAQVKVLAIGPPPYVRPGCERGREFQVLVQTLGSYPYSNWTYPRYLNCP